MFADAKLRIAGSLLAGLMAAASPYQSVAAPVAWLDAFTGFAIGGYDPVAYYTQKKSLPGETGIEHRWGGVVWRFANVGNRDAFARYPEVYAPKYAGYDAEALARGLTVTGSPEFFLMQDNRVLFFRDQSSLRRWRENAAEMTAKADDNWKKLSRDIPGTSRY